jgi:hypothetical protein
VATPIQYPDTAEGALQYLRDDSSLDLDGATTQCDPWVEGVWKVILAVPEPEIGQEIEAIVYLGGYRCPLGDVRATNDFECFCHDPEEEEPTELERCLGL